MQLKALPDLIRFFSTVIAEGDAEQDETTTQAFAKSTPADRIHAIRAQLRLLIDSSDISLEEIGTEANRWFGDSEEAVTWLNLLLNALAIAGTSTAESDEPTLDSNGATLAEGDAVTVIKDLKVKGGSSDLKRGTLIKKIHLIGDPDNIECRVDGSTLVLKTCFLKKA